LVRLLAWLTLLPDCGALPVSSQTRDMLCSSDTLKRANAHKKLNFEPPL
jgi:hypothetical protein